MEALLILNSHPLIIYRFRVEVGSSTSAQPIGSSKPSCGCGLLRYRRPQGRVNATPYEDLKPLWETPLNGSGGCLPDIRIRPDGFDTGAALSAVC